MVQLILFGTSSRPYLISSGRRRHGKRTLPVRVILYNICRSYRMADKRKWDYSAADHVLAQTYVLHVTKYWSRVNNVTATQSLRISTTRLGGYAATRVPLPTYFIRIIPWRVQKLTLNTSVYRHSFLRENSVNIFPLYTKFDYTSGGFSTFLLTGKT